jgi:hypothetical protein
MAIQLPVDPLASLHKCREAYDLFANLSADMGYCEKGLAIYDQAIQLNLINVVAYRNKGQLIQIFLSTATTMLLQPITKSHCLIPTL